MVVKNQEHAENAPIHQMTNNGRQSNQNRPPSTNDQPDNNGRQSNQECDAENNPPIQPNDNSLQNDQKGDAENIPLIQPNQDRNGVRECDNNDEYDYYCFLDCQCCFDIPKYDDRRELLQTIGKNDLLFGFPTMLGSIKNTMFLPPEGPMGALIIYYILGFCIIVLPEDFENSVLGQAISVFRRRNVNQNSASYGHDVEQGTTNQSEGSEEQISKGYLRVKIILKN
ncbi:Hypothetical predicted protein [Mytilus galloprovincialis]|uniref:Uncharacterized protein n=1 Tax=Mytilus galloprovincialis TaxID=29158 RepID=A0A8B6FVS2_MYTGA|nr:Hypothetical predicted protein [Mytilus galloprovincialis]